MSLLAIFILISDSCVQQDDPPPVPVLFTGEVVEITEEGSKFSGLFENVDADRVTDFGFIWGMGESVSLPNSLKYSLPLPFKEGEYTYELQTSLKKDIAYYLRIFVTYDDNTIYYGKAVEFLSLGSKKPEILNLDPPSACFGDTVRIIGKYFGLETNNKQVYFGIDQATVVLANDTLIETIVPYCSTKNSYSSTNNINIKVIREGYPTGETDLFQLSPPRITSYYPKEGGSYTGITIEGSGFHPEFTTLTLGEYPCDVQRVEDHLIKAFLPPLFNDLEENLRLTVATTQTILGTAKVLAPVIDYVSPDTVFSNEILTLHGRNLDNYNLQFTMNKKLASRIVPYPDYSEDTIFLKVPDGICASKLNLQMELMDNAKIYEDPIAFRQPRVTNIEREENDLFNGIIRISVEYFPNLLSVSSVEVNSQKANYNYMLGDSLSSMSIHVPANVLPENEWLNANIKLCPASELSLDSVFQIPSPEIHHVPDTIYPSSNNTISGAFFNTISENNQISIGGYMMSPRIAQNSAKIIFRPSSDLTEGTYSLSVTTNGQVSNQVEVEIIHRWKKLDDLPEEIGGYKILFLHNNTLFMGGGIWSESKIFYSFDLQTREWKMLNPMPFNAHYGVSDGEFAYVYGQGQIFRYDYNTDTWMLLGERTVDNIIGNTYYEECSSVFYHDNKIFTMPVGVNQPHFYFDLETNTWTEFPGWTGSVRGLWRMPCVLGEGEAYLFHEWDIYTLDLTDLSFADTGTQRPDDDKSRIGFSYKGEAYLYGGSGWEIYNIQDSFSYRYISGPSAYKAAIVKDDNIVYLLSYNELWTFDLTMQ